LLVLLIIFAVFIFINANATVKAESAASGTANRATIQR
jgi:hypothetical protein